MKLPVRAYWRKITDCAIRSDVSCISLMANIAEDFGRRSNREFSNFPNIAHASAAETRSHLYIALDLNYLSESDFNRLYKLYDENSRMIMSLSQHLKRKL